MFGTLRYDAQNDDTQFIERTTNPLSGEGDGQGPRYSACDKCRAKKQRCGGQRDGCDRCKRTSSTCVYSLEGKGRGNRRRRRTEGHNSTSPGDSPPSSAPFVRRTTNTNGSEKAVKSRAPSPPKLVTPPPSTTTQNASLDDVMDFSPVGSFEDDFLMIQDILPDYDGQNIDNYLDTLTLPAQGDNDLDFYFGSGSSSDQISQAPSLVDQTTSLVDQPALVKTPQEFSLDSFLSTPPGFDGLTNIPATPREAFNLIAQASVNREDHQNPKSVYPNQANQPHTRCQCLNTVAVLLEELEAKSKLVDPAALDSILASQKEALGRCNSVLSCTTCFPKPEYILLLGMVTERLACLCEATVTKYLEEAAQRQSNSVTEASNGRHHSRTSSAGSGGAKVFLGSYEIESPEEYNGVIRFLIALQLQSLRKFIEGMKKAAGTGPSCASQLPKVQAAEKRVAKLIQKIRLQPTGKLGSEGRANGAVMSSL